MGNRCWYKWNVCQCSTRKKQDPATREKCHVYIVLLIFKTKNNSQKSKQPNWHGGKPVCIPLKKGHKFKSTLEYLTSSPVRFFQTCRVLHVWLDRGGQLNEKREKTSLRCWLHLDRPAKRINCLDSSQKQKRFEGQHLKCQLLFSLLVCPSSLHHFSNWERSWRFSRSSLRSREKHLLNSTHFVCTAAYGCSRWKELVWAGRREGPSLPWSHG